MLKIIIFCQFLLLLVGCSGFSVTGGPGPTVMPHLVTTAQAPGQLRNLNSLLLFPPEFSEQARLATSNRSRLYSALSEAAEQELGIKLVMGSEIFKRYEGQALPHTSAEALRLAREMKLDGVLVTTVNNYVEREGSRIGADQPAEVSFTFSLFDTVTGSELWHGSYFYQDQAVTDNLFRLGDRMKHNEAPNFRRADDLARDGFKAAFADLAEKRLSQFR